MLRMDEKESQFAQFGDSNREVPEGFGPLGCLAGGFTEAQLEDLGGVVDKCSGPVGYVPIAPLAAEDMSQTLSSVLDQVRERDAIIPNHAAELDLPFVLFSGMTAEMLRDMVAAVTEAKRAGRLPMETACAVAVPKAMSKALSQVMVEVIDDQQRNVAPPE